MMKKRNCKFTVDVYLLFYLVAGYVSLMTFFVNFVFVINAT